MPSRLYILLLVLFALTGCYTAHFASDLYSEDPSSGVETRLRSLTADWHGVPHRWGGTTRKGIDCSAFVQMALRTEFGVSLPRTTREQVNKGTSVKRNRLQVGDLVFFKTKPRIRHVGLYLGDGTFAHASTSRGVTISELDDPYWTQRYWTARRVLDTPALPQSVTQASERSERRRGW